AKNILRIRTIFLHANRIDCALTHSPALSWTESARQRLPRRKIYFESELYFCTQTASIAPSRTRVHSAGPTSQPGSACLGEKYTSNPNYIFCTQIVFSAQTRWRVRGLEG